MSDPSSSVIPSLQASAPTGHTTIPRSNSQAYKQAGYKKPTVEDFHEEPEEEKKNKGTDKKRLIVMEQEEPEEEKKNKGTDKKRLIVMEQAERFLRTVPAGISVRVRELMEKMASGEEVKDWKEDSEDSENEESDEDDMDGWGHITKMAIEVKRRHEEELIKYWVAKAVRNRRRMRSGRCTIAENKCCHLG